MYNLLWDAALLAVRAACAALHVCRTLWDCMSGQDAKVENNCIFLFSHRVLFFDTYTNSVYNINNKLKNIIQTLLLNECSYTKHT